LSFDGVQTYADPFAAVVCRYDDGDERRVGHE
jgi:hypothetical protein